MIDSMQDNLVYRNKYPEFVYDSYEVDRTPEAIRVTYTYILGEHTFKPTVEIPVSDIHNDNIDNHFLNYLFFNFGVINAINYYKLSIAPKFVVKAGYLDDKQKLFFRKLFANGLGEFLYVNNLPFDFNSLMLIDSAPAPETKPTYEIGDNFSGNLIPVGGGKDSVVTIEALQPMHENNMCLQYNRDIYPENRAALDCIKSAGYRISDIANFNLTLDPLMLELNRQGFYNGHIPFSSCLAFASYIMAYLNNKANIVLSNEASANEGNIVGTTINHQYSKSFEFEADFQWYANTYFTDKIHYFSLLRCLNEYEIVQKFIRRPVYMNIFRSCNVGTHENKWCGHCAKCLYVFIMLYPFVSLDKLKSIFGSNLFDDESLLTILIGLVFPNEHKPFECVGTKEEINYSLKLAVENTTGELPVLLKWYQQNCYNPNAVYNVTNYYNPQHHIPQDYLQLILNS